MTMKYITITNTFEIQKVKEFNTLEELNNYYGFNFKESDKFPTMKDYVNGELTYMIINRIED